MPLQLVQYPQVTSSTAISGRAASMEGPEGPEDSTPSVTFNLIRKIQPDQKRLNLPDRVYALPQQAFL